MSEQCGSVGFLKIEAVKSQFPVRYCCKMLSQTLNGMGQLTGIYESLKEKEILSENSDTGSARTAALSPPKRMIFLRGGSGCTLNSEPSDK